VSRASGKEAISPMKAAAPSIQGSGMDCKRKFQSIESMADSDLARMLLQAD
jgi:hypothetical protein